MMMALGMRERRSYRPQDLVSNFAIWKKLTESEGRNFDIRKQLLGVWWCSKWSASGYFLFRQRFWNDGLWMIYSDAISAMREVVVTGLVDEFYNRRKVSSICGILKD